MENDTPFKPADLKVIRQKQISQLMTLADSLIKDAEQAPSLNALNLLEKRAKVVLVVAKAAEQIHKMVGDDGDNDMETDETDGSGDDQDARESWGLKLERKLFGMAEQRRNFLLAEAAEQRDLAAQDDGVGVLRDRGPDAAAG
ncbi:hypothetical protein [Asticcacaulis sp. YBE204]|uniref:hypothetical protein n=1 Tax=Asticcacaulis sp. YBE204 TaxID=1282363 RepID=UPI0003C3B2A3|nr:hypothetical protein [Asticcacaulis sp. YBE204]ESQ79540.1 hypothetical protein AEYBE204_06765 [Asticcacaulis sp. YBE204]